MLVTSCANKLSEKPPQIQTTHTCFQTMRVSWRVWASGGLCSKLAIFHCILVHVFCHSTHHHGDLLSFPLSCAVMHTLQHTAAEMCKYGDTVTPYMATSLTHLLLPSVCGTLVTPKDGRIHLPCWRDTKKTVTDTYGVWRGGDKKLAAACKGQLPLQISVLAEGQMVSHHWSTNILEHMRGQDISHAKGK